MNFDKEKMKNVFTQWLSKKNESPMADFGYTMNDMQPYDFDNLKKDLLEILYNRYNEEFVDFVETLANGRNDSELSNIVNKMSKVQHTQTKPKHFEPHDVMMPTADQGGDSQED